MWNFNFALLSQSYQRLFEEEFHSVMVQSVVADHGLAVLLHEGTDAAGQHAVRAAAAL